MIIRTQSYARGGLIGNPSDGFHGKCISFIIKNFSARVTLYESPKLEIQPNVQDHSTFDSLEALDYDVQYYGYYGGVRLIKAALRRFYRHCKKRGVALRDRNCTIEYSSDIPVRVGLAGSSAIVTATLRALMQFYEVDIPQPELPTVTLSAETQELNIPAGLQDRVIQAYEGCVYMDLAREIVERQGYGNYEALDPALLPPLFVAYHDHLAEGTEVLHNDLRQRWRRGDVEVIAAVEHWAGLAAECRRLILSERGAEIGPLLDQNFDRRIEVCQISQLNRDLVQRARRLGCPAKFCGSGGAVVGICENDEKFGELEQSYAEIGAKIIRPIVE